MARIPVNFERYLQLVTELHTAVIFLGLAGSAVVWRRDDRSGNPRRLAIALSALLMIVVNVAIHLPYLFPDQWPYVRFLLPGLAALFILLAATLARCAEWLRARGRWLAPLALIPLVPIVLQARMPIQYTLNDWFQQTRIVFMGNYLREVLPANAAVLSFMHSGEIRHYTGRQVVRLDVFEPTSLDRVVDDLQRHGYRPVFVLDGESTRLALFVRGLRNRSTDGWTGRRAPRLRRRRASGISTRPTASGMRAASGGRLTRCAEADRRFRRPQITHQRVDALLRVQRPCQGSDQDTG